MDGGHPPEAGGGALRAEQGCLTPLGLRELPAMTPADPAASLPGRATAAATAEYARRLQHVARPEHFREAHCLKVSSIGIGTYLGPATSDADASYSSAIVRAIDLGCNFIDTPINYRHQRGHRCVGAALRTA